MPSLTGDRPVGPRSKRIVIACHVCGWMGETYVWTIDGHRSILCAGCAADARRSGVTITMGDTHHAS